jgi:hypothetical protein
MKIAIAQLNYHIGNFALNTKKIVDIIRTIYSSTRNLLNNRIWRLNRLPRIASASQPLLAGQALILNRVAKSFSTPHFL